MRFFEYESRAIVAKAGIPVTRHGFAKTPEEARRIAEEIAGPVVIKSQVLTGGRMKAGGVQFADSPEEAAQLAEQVLALEINGHMPRGVLVDSRAAVKHEYYAGVVWDGTRKRPVMLFSDMGGIDIVARGVIKACLELGYDPAEKIAIFRIPGAWEEEGFKILEKYGVEYADRSVSLHEAARRAVEKIQGAAS